MKVIVVGAGSFGSWSALKLQQAGCNVVLVDAWGPGNSRSSSGGETRVIRTVYGHDSMYVEMARQCIDEWNHFQTAAQASLMEMTGSLWFCGEDDSYVQAAIPSIKSVGLEMQEYSKEEASSRWPQINFEGLNKIFLEPLAGFLRARLACSVLTREFVKQGGEFVQGCVKAPRLDSPCHKIELESGETFTADQIVFAAGPWLKKLLAAQLASLIQVSRQEVYYVGTPAGRREYESDQCPIWLDLNQPIYYGIPSVDRRGFKLARDERGEEFDPDIDHRFATAELVTQATEYLRFRFPGLGNAPLQESRVCQYSNTLDGHFILDRIVPSGLVIVGGGSGHGFKMGPAIGKRVVDLIQRDEIDSAFALNRFDSINKKSTQFDHS